MPFRNLETIHAESFVKEKFDPRKKSLGICMLHSSLHMPCLPFSIPILSTIFE